MTDSRYLNVTDGRTDRRTDDIGRLLLHNRFFVVLRGKNCWREIDPNGVCLRKFQGF